MSELIFLHHKQLKIHPQNIRLYYPDSDVAQMAASIRAAAGVYQAMLIVPTGEPETYHVVDGNLRLMAARSLAGECPPLKCEIIQADHAQQMLVMAVTSRRQYPKDPISEARHFKRLIDQEGLSVEEIAAITGDSRSLIYGRLKWLELDETIQQFVIERKLSADPKVCRALLEISDPVQRYDLASRFARNGTSVTRIQRACRHVLRQAHKLNGAPPLPAKRERKVEIVKPAANGQLNPAKVMDIAGKTLCEGCVLNGLGEDCYTCPGPYEFIDHLVEMCEVRTQTA